MKTLKRKPVMSSLAIVAAAGLIWAAASGMNAAPLVEPTPQTKTAEAPLEGALKGKNLIVITLDTTRADYLGCYNGPAGLTPNMDRLASQGTQFLTAYSQTNVTNPSHTAIFTGLYAVDSKIMNNVTTFSFASPEGDTLGLAFKRAGYRTAAFPATPHVSKAILDLPGFDYSADAPPGLKAEQNVDRAIEWLSMQSGKPFFAWVHFFDPHMKYEPPKPYQDQFHTGDPTKGNGSPFKEDANFMHSPDIVIEQFGEVRDRSYPPAMYKGEIRYTDEQVGRLLKYLENRGLDKNTGVLLLADHGESLGEHEIYFDHYGLYETSLKIPFLAKLPGFPAGVKCKDVVNQIDLAPTVSHLYGLDLEQRFPMHGLNLTQSLRDQPNPALGRRDGMVHEDAHNRQIMARKGPWKLTHQLIIKYTHTAKTMLFNIEEDPGEVNNLAERYPDKVAEMMPLIQLWIDLGPWDFKNPKNENHGEKMDAERARLDEELRGMGYMDNTEEDESEGGRKEEDNRQLPFSAAAFEQFINDQKFDFTPKQKENLAAALKKYKLALRDANKEGDGKKARELRQSMRRDVAMILTPEQNQRLTVAINQHINKQEKE